MTTLREGYGLDVWCDPAEEIAVLQRELDLVGDADSAAPLLLYEIGRICLATGDETQALQYLLRSYEARPGFRPPLRLTRAIYRDRGGVRLAMKLLEAEARATSDPYSRSALLREQGRMLWADVGNLSAARARLDEALQQDPTDLATLLLLELLHAVAGDADGRIAITDRQLQIVGDPTLRVALLADQALLAGDTQPMRAIESLLAAEELNPQHISVVLFLEYFAAAAGQHGEVVRLIERQARLAATEPVWNAHLLARAGRVLRDRLNDAEGALQAFRRSLAAHSEYSVAADAFELACQERHHGEALEIGSQLIDLEPVARERAALAFRLGEICRRQLDDPDQATRWYRRCLRWVPTYQPALEELSTILDEAGQLKPLLEVHQANLDRLTSPQSRAQSLFRIGEILTRYQRPEQASAAHREALAAAPDFLPSLQALERLYLREERWAELVDLYEHQLQHGRDDERTFSTLERLAETCQYQLGDSNRALDTYLQLLEHKPDELRIVRTAARLCAETRRWKDLLTLNQREVELTTNLQRKAELLQSSGCIFEERLFDLDEAVRCYRSALEHAPEYLPALRALGRLYRQKGRWLDLIAMCRAEINVCGDTDRIVSLLYSIAEVYLEELLDPDRAIATYYEILDRRPDQGPAARALVRLLSTQGRWNDLLEVLRLNHAAAMDELSAAVALWQSARLREERMGDVAGAVRDFTQALRIAPTWLPAQLAAVRSLEEQRYRPKLIEVLRACIQHATNTEHRRAWSLRLAAVLAEGEPTLAQAASIYEELAREQPEAWVDWIVYHIRRRLGHVRGAAEALERLLDHCTDDGTAARLHLRLGILREWSGLEDPLPHYEEAERITPSCGYAPRALRRLTRRSADQRQTIAVLSQRLVQSNHPLEGASIASELGNLHLRRGQPVEAEHAYREALRLSPGHPVAMRALTTLLDDQQRWAELIDLVETQSKHLEDPLNRADALAWGAAVAQTRVADATRAERLCRAALEIAPAHKSALTLLRGFLEANGAWADLALTIEAYLDATPSNAPDRATMLMLLGDIYLERLALPDKAEPFYFQVLDHDPHSVSALVHLGDIYFEQGNADQALAVLLHAESSTEDDTLRYGIRRRLAEAHRDLGDPLQAVRILEQLTNDTRAVEPDLWRQLSRAAAASGSVQVEIRALEHLAMTSRHRDEQIHVRKQAARLALEQQRDTARAAHLLQQVLASDPLDIEAIEQLTTLYEHEHQEAARAQLLRAAVAHHRADLARQPEQAQLYRQLARIAYLQRQPERAYGALIALGHLTSLDPEEEAVIAAEHTHTSRNAGRLTGEDRQRSLLPDIAHTVAFDLLRRIAPLFEEAIATKPSALQLTRSAKLRPDHPTYETVAEIAGWLGTSTPDVWVSPNGGETLGTCVLGGPALLLGEDTAAASTSPWERFRIGRALFYIAERQLPLYGRRHDEILALLLSMADLAAVSLPMITLTAGSVDISRWATAIAAKITRKGRQRLSLLLPRVAAHCRAEDIETHVAAFGHAADCAGALVCGDPRTVIDRIAQQERDLNPHTRLAALLRFLVSDEYNVLRQQLRGSAIDG